MMADAATPGEPGETLLGDLSHLTADARVRGITTRRELNEVESENIARVFVKYLSAKPSARLAPFDYSWVVKVHKEMFCDVWRWAGQIRNEDLNLGVMSANIRGELYGLVEDLKSWNGFAMPMTEQGVRLHHRAVRIHPFMNGNGRWSRLLANIWLKRNAAPLTNWPEEIIGQESVIRQEYIAAIQAADSGDYAALIAMHERYAG